MKIDEKFMNYKLCFVDSEEWAGDPIILYFTELDDVTEQWGDDWNDRPYEHNAGEPYENDYSQPEQGVKNGVGIYPEISIYKLVITGGYNIATPRTGTNNSPYSVEDINKGIVPWLTIKGRNDNVTFVKAGTTLRDTLKALEIIKNNIYVYAYIDLDENLNFDINVKEIYNDRKNSL